MKSFSTRLAVGLVAVCLGSARADELKAGAAQVDITPPAGTPMSGYYFARAADGVHDPLRAKALVIESGGERAALVILDLISTTRDLVDEARAEVGKVTKVPPAHVMISATHAHTGPVISGRGARDADFGGTHELAKAYRAALPGKIAEAVKQAEAALVPAKARAVIGREESIAFNRRFHMLDGSVSWNPGKKNPRVLKPAGPIDPQVPVVCLERADAADGAPPIATYVSYAVHLDNIGGAQVSADLPGVLARLMGEVHGPDMVTLWAAGCCGDINHVNVNWSTPQKGFENAGRMGIILAAEVLRSWPKLEAVGSGPLRVKSRKVSLPPPPVTDEDVARANAVLERQTSAPQGQKPSFLELVDAYKVIDVKTHGGPREVEVQVVTLGREVAWVSLPGEIFVELGLAIKQDSPFGVTIPVELANGAVGYIPTRRAYTQGNYEVVSARVAEGSGEMLVDAAVAMLKELYAEADPKTASAR